MGTAVLLGLPRAKQELQHAHLTPAGPMGAARDLPFPGDRAT